MSDSKGIDVLAVMDSVLAFASRGIERDDPVRNLIEVGHDARDTVAELIEASRDLQDAMDEHEKHKFDIGPSRRFIAADARVRAALAACAPAKGNAP